VAQPCDDDSVPDSVAGRREGDYRNPPDTDNCGSTPLQHDPKTEQASKRDLEDGMVTVIDRAD